MSVETLKQELAALNAKEQRQLTAFLVSIQDERDDAYRSKLAAKINKPSSEFATLEELDKRLNLGDNGNK